MTTNPHTLSPTPLGYMKQLDALRGVAIAAVLLEHFLPPDHVLRNIPWGALGVQLFFVLSGYLITLILLDARTAAEAGAGKRHVLRNFYIRRFLRIFPIYYLTLFLAALFDVTIVRSTFFWHLAYLSNWYFVFHGPKEPIFHLWSLAVEEQFYLVWPWLIIFLPRSRLFPAVGLAILAAPLTRYFMVLADWPATSVAWSTPCCLDTLGSGALLAVLTRNPEVGLERKRFLRSGLFVGLPLTLLLLPMYNPRAEGGLTALGAVFFNSAIALFFVWLVGGAATGFTGLGGKLLALAPLVALGRISYGVYLYHTFVPWTLEQCGVSLEGLGDWGRLAVLTAIAVAVAALSWQVIEKPINGLKRYFPAA